jgi:hypothetical protein
MYYFHCQSWETCDRIMDETLVNELNYKVVEDTRRVSKMHKS